MPNYRDTNYHVNFLAGTSGMTGKPGGRIFWVGASGYTAVNGAAPSDGNNGLSPQTPFATIQKGLDSCTSGRGDTVAILPGSYTITASLTMTNADVSLVSAVPVKPTEYSPVIITAAATYDNNLIQVDADNCTISGIGFENGFTTVTANQEVIQINSTNTTTDIYGCVVENCFLDFTRAAGAASAADTDLDGIRVGLDSNDRAFNSIVRGCTIQGCDQDAISISAGSLNAKIMNNVIYDGIGSELTRYGVDILALNATVSNNIIKVGTNSTTAAAVKVDVAAAHAVVTDNNLVAWGADTTCIQFLATATGWSMANWCVAVAAGNLVDYLTDNTTPSANADVGGVFAAAPGATALVTPTVGGL